MSLYLPIHISDLRYVYSEDLKWSTHTVSTFFLCVYMHILIGLAKSGALVIVDDCDVDMASASDDQLMGIDQVNDAWRHMLAYGIVKPLPVLFDTCQHAGLCIGRFA